MRPSADHVLCRSLGRTSRRGVRRPGEVGELEILFAFPYLNEQGDDSNTDGERFLVVLEEQSRELDARARPAAAAALVPGVPFALPGRLQHVRHAAIAFVAGVLEDRGSRIAYLAESENGRSLWLVDADGRNPRPVIDGVLGFDFYLDDNRVLYSRVSSEDEGPPELWARNLDTGEEVLLLRAPIAEIFTSRDGAWVGYCYGYSHFTQDIYRLRLEVPSSPIGLPSARGGQERVTFGEGTWHAHLGAFSPDGTSVAYSRDLDRGDIYIVENFK